MRRVGIRIGIGRKAQSPLPDSLVIACFVLALGMEICVGLINGRIVAAQEKMSRVTLRGVLVDGASVETQLDRKGRFVDGRSLADFRMLTRRAQPFDSPGQTPVRILTLATGERLPVQARSQVSCVLDPGKKLRTYEDVLFFGQPIVVPFAAVHSVATPDGAQDVVVSGSPIPDGFWTQKEGRIRRVRLPPEMQDPAPNSGKQRAVLLDVPKDGFFRRDFDLPVGKVSVELAVFWPGNGHGAIDLLFEKKSGFRLSLEQDRIRVSRLGAMRAAIASSLIRVEDAHQPLALRLRMGRGVTLSLAGRVLAHGSQSPGPFRAIVVRSEPRPANLPAVKPLPFPHEAGGPVPIACLVQRGNSQSFRRGSEKTPDRIAVDTHVGDVFYGDSVEFGPRKVELETRFGVATFGTAEVSRIRFPRVPLPARSPVSGDVCRVQLAPDSAMTFFGPQPICELTGAVRLTGDSVEIDHPLLRLEAAREEDATRNPRMKIPWARVQKIEPLFQGEYRLLDAGPRHLGNQIQRSFSHPNPDGTKWTLPFNLKELPRGRAFLSVEVADLEPGSPGTLQATPKLSEVRRGFLTTRVFVNDVDAGSINRHCEFLSPVGEPSRLRIPLPVEALRIGRNAIELRQKPSRNDPSAFDDCELRRIALEFENERLDVDS